MGQVIQNNFRVRKHYGRIQKIIDIPNLIDIQKKSYDKLLQKDVAPDRREDVGLQGVFKSGVSDQGFLGDRPRSSLSLQPRAAQVRRGGVPAPGGMTMRPRSRSPSVWWSGT